MDLGLIENGDGGDVQLVSNDLALVYGIENMPYLGLFGGNPGFPTTQTRIEDHNFDWWGNNLLMPSQGSIQFNSLTEKKLASTALTSSGRVEIENAVKKDLEFMKAFAEVKVSVYLVSDDHLVIELRITPVNAGTKIKIVNFRKKYNGDFFFFDFNDDFFV